MKSTYVVQRDEKSFCPKCGKSVDLLCNSSIEPFIWPWDPEKRPWFYVCWACKHIAQVGVGPVEREEGQ
jgi:rRNA maturation endonuclease Nob1